MNHWNIRLFGQLTVNHGDKEPINLSCAKERELLSYLTLRRHRTQQRDLLATTLWGDTTTDRAKKNLRTTLWKLRADSTIEAESQPLILSTKNWVRLNPDTGVWADVHVIESVYDQIHGKPAEHLAPEEVDLLRDTMRLYSGPLLEGWSHNWCWAARERLQQVYLELADKLMAYYEVHRCSDLGIGVGLRILREDPALERTHRRMMRFYLNTGDRTAALRQYSRCIVILQEELGVEPSPATRALHEQIRIDKHLPSQTTPPETASPDLDSLLDSLSSLQTQLSEIRQMIIQST